MTPAISASCNEVKAVTVTSRPNLDNIAKNLKPGAITKTPHVSVEVMIGGPSTGKPSKPSQQDVIQVDWVLTETPR